MIHFEDKGRLRQLRDKLGRFTSLIEERPYDILLEEAPRMEEEAKMQVPYDPFNNGVHLREGIYCQVWREKKTLVYLQMVAVANARHDGYDYSEIQHNNESYNHPSLRNQAKGVVEGGKANYLRDPYDAGVNRITKRMYEELHYAL